MNTLNELLQYCDELEPVGALLLAGEWGCGKTYLIDHQLNDAISDKAVLIRVSLFGISSSKEIHDAIKSSWVEEYCKEKGINSFTDKIDAGKKIIAKLDFLPDWIKGVASTDISSIIPISNKIEDKSVILVFDDLERCQMSTTDVLGVINDYCENLKYHTIIIANQDKINSHEKSSKATAELQLDYPNGSKPSSFEKATLVIDNFNSVTNDSLRYSEIKEKIIQRTVLYVPDFVKIVSAVIDDFKTQDQTYKSFVKDCEHGLLELFAPDRTSAFNNDDIDGETPTRPHNIRSLKCAISDFYRVYKVLKENDFENIENWFFSFTSYVIAYKADLIKEGRYGTMFSDDKVKDLFPVFQNEYLFTGVKNWILHGIWDEKQINYEINIRKQQNQARKPSEILKVSRIMDVDEEIIHSGLSELLDNAYSGNLNFDNYVLLIQNSCWARYYKYTLPLSIDWNQVEKGVDILIEQTKEKSIDGQLLYHLIGDDQRKYFNDSELKIYSKIYQFTVGEGFVFAQNYRLYIEYMRDLKSKAYIMVQNKRFNIFNEEMAIVTVRAYDEDSNFEKRIHIDSFRSLWNLNIKSQEFNKDTSLKGFEKFKELLIELHKKYEENGKTFAAIHTNDFIKVAEILIEGIKQQSK